MSNERNDEWRCACGKYDLPSRAVGLSNNSGSHWLHGCSDTPATPPEPVCDDPNCDSTYPDSKHVHPFATPPEPSAEGRTWISVTDSLPKAGRWVLAAFQNDLGKGRVVRAYYAPPRTLEQNDLEGDWFDYDEEKDFYWLPEGWYECNDYDETNWKIQESVTHWMPLPKHPLTNTEEPSHE